LDKRDFWRRFGSRHEFANEFPVFSRDRTDHDGSIAKLRATSRLYEFSCIFLVLSARARSGGEINPPKSLSLPPLGPLGRNLCLPVVAECLCTLSTRERERDREQRGTKRNGRGREDARRAADTMPPFYRKSQSPSRRLKVPPWKNITSPLAGSE